MNTNHWAMYNDEGNAAVAQMMARIKNYVKTQPLPVVRNLLHQEMKQIGKKYEEIYDTDVRDIIADELTDWASSVHEIKIGSDYWNI